MMDHFSINPALIGKSPAMPYSSFPTPRFLPSRGVAGICAYRAPVRP